MKIPEKLPIIRGLAAHVQRHDVRPQGLRQGRLRPAQLRTRAQGLGERLAAQQRQQGAEHEIEGAQPGWHILQKSWHILECLDHLDLFLCGEVRWMLGSGQY